MSLVLESRLWSDQVLFDAYSILRELDSVAKATSHDNAKDRGVVSSHHEALMEKDGGVRGGHPAKYPKRDEGHTHSPEAPPPMVRPDKESESNVSRVSKEKLWVAPNLRVRIVDRAFKKGKYYNSKVRGVV